MPQTEEKGNYFNDVENAGEISRLIKQDRLMTAETGGLFPEQLDLSTVHTVLDIACGPSGWAHDVAQAYPALQVTGIDLSQTMIHFARAVLAPQPNTHFRVMDATQPLDFPDQSFDLVNARLIFGFMPTTTWPRLLQECFRILRPDGIICLCENEAPITNSLAVEQLSALFNQAMKNRGQSFSPDGRHIGITPMLGRLLHDAGFQDIQKQARAIDFSAGTAIHDSLYRDYSIVFTLAQPFLVKAGVATDGEVTTLYHEMLREMHADTFCAIWYVLRAWGYKPTERGMAAP